MTFLEANAKAMVNTISTNFEAAYDCKLPEHVKLEHEKEVMAEFKLLEDWIKSI